MIICCRFHPMTVERRRQGRILFAEVCCGPWPWVLAVSRELCTQLTNRHPPSSQLVSSDTPLQFDYYQLPFCRPELIHDLPENLGEALAGEKAHTSKFAAFMGVCLTLTSLAVCLVVWQSSQSPPISLAVSLLSPVSATSTARRCAAKSTLPRRWRSSKILPSSTTVSTCG